MKKLLCFAGAIFLLGTAAFGQVCSNPNDEFYEKAITWEVQGIIDVLPQVRPYPLHVVEDILEKVIDCDNQKESKIAQKEFHRIFGKPFHVETAASETLVADKNTTSGASNHKGLFDIDAHVQGDKDIFKYGGLSYSLGFYLVEDNEADHLPLWTNIRHDAVQDSYGIGKFNGFADMNCNAYFGNNYVFGTAGINRFGFGPFWQEGLCLNDSAYHSSGLSLTAKFAPKWMFTQVYSSIGATNNLGKDISSSKYFSLHSLKWFVSKKFSFSYYENCVFGRRMELSYLFPVPYMINQGITGCNDNLQMGLLFEARPFTGLKLSGDFFVDDISINFSKFPDDKYRFGTSLGIQYAPQNMFLRMIDANYTAIMPYVYAHWDYDDYQNYHIDGSTINYQNYTNSGVAIGSSLPPDSDRIRFKVKMNPVNNLDIGINLGFTRHQNVCEVLSDTEALCYLLSENGKYATDGSFYTHQLFEGNDVTAAVFNTNPEGFMYLDSAWNHLMFMKGSHTMFVFNTGIDATYTLGSSKTGSLKIGLSYNLDYIKNAGVDSNIYPGQGGLKSLGNGRYEWNGKTYETAELLVKDASKAVEAARRDWASSLYDTVNHYITLSLTYCW